MTAATPLLLTVEEAAAMLAIGRTRVYALIRAGVLPSVQIGYSRRVPTAALQQYVAGLTVDPDSNGDQAA